MGLVNLFLIANINASAHSQFNPIRAGIWNGYLMPGEGGGGALRTPPMFSVKEPPEANYCLHNGR